MAKRFIDTAILKHHFTRGLDTAYKLLWIHILTDCSHAGIWQVDWQIAGIVVGAKIDPAKAKKVFNTKIVELKNGSQWFLPDFIEFQYGRLSEKNKAHNGIISLLKRENLLTDAFELKNPQGASKPLASSLQGAKEKEMDMDMDMDMEKEMEKEKGVVGEKPKSHSDYKNCIQVYSEFIKLRTSAPARIDSLGGKSMNEIITQLSKYDSVKDGKRTAAELLQYILDHFNDWLPFHQSQIKLNQINSNLENIINSVKNGKPKTGKNAGADELHKLAELQRSGVKIDYASMFD